MNTSVIIGILIPFAGTSLGAAFVFFMKKREPVWMELSGSALLVGKK